MKPYLAVQPLLRVNKVINKWEIVGSCFRLSSSNHFITADHCVKGAESSELRIMNVLSDDHDLDSIAIYHHDKADIAVIEVKGEVPSVFQTFHLPEKDDMVGIQVHCFGFPLDWEKSPLYAPGRVIGGIIQRGLTYNDGVYSSSALELSVPIPKGMSGGPAFIANRDTVAIGVAIATIQSEIVVSGFEEYEKGAIKEKERISEITRYGIILRVLGVRDWLEKTIPKES